MSGPDDPPSARRSHPTWGTDESLHGTWREAFERPDAGPKPLFGIRERYGDETEELGRGGLGRVVARWDHVLEREVAVKELLESEAAGALTRFLREARITAALEHPAVIPVHELGIREDGRWFYTMRRIRGRTLAAVIEACATPQERLALIDPFITACQAVAYAHSRGVVHRDLKPSNIMLGAFGETVVLDWGLAKAQGVDEAPFDEPALGAEAHHTRAGAVMGTPAYMSPEQANGQSERVDARSDVHALGVLLWEILVGMPAFRGPTVSILEAVRDVSRPSVRGPAPEIPPDLAAIAEKAMAWDPADRYPDAGALARDLEAYRRGHAVGAYRYAMGERARQIAARSPLVVGSLLAGLALSSGIAGGAAWWLHGARADAAAAAERARAGEQALSSELAASHEENAARALLDGDAAEAERLAAAALSLQERPLARGVWLGARQRPALSLVATVDGIPRCGALAWDPTGQRLATCGGTGEILVIDGAHPDRFLWTAQGDPNPVVAMAWSFDGASLAVARRGVEIWSSAGVRTGAPDLGGVVPERVGWLPDGRLLVAGGSAWCAGDPCVPLPAVDGDIRALAVAPDGRVAIGTGDTVRVWRDSRIETEIQAGAPVSALAWGPTDLAIGTARGGLTVGRRSVDAHRGAVRTLTWTGAGLYSAGEDGRVRAWTPGLHAQAALPRQEGYGVALATHGTLLATRSGGPVRIWSAAADRRGSWVLPQAAVELAWGPDGLQTRDRRGPCRLALAGCLDSSGALTIASKEIWRGEPPLRLAGVGADGSADVVDGREWIRIAPDGSEAFRRELPDAPSDVLASSEAWLAGAVGSDEVLLVSASGSKVLSGHSGAVVALAFSPDGRTLASASTDHTARIWRTADGLEQARLPHAESVLALAFEPGGATLATACADRSVQFWSVTATGDGPGTP